LNWAASSISRLSMSNFTQASMLCSFRPQVEETNPVDAELIKTLRVIDYLVVYSGGSCSFLSSRPVLTVCLFFTSFQAGRGDAKPLRVIKGCSGFLCYHMYI
jgi:hypothetical protein